MRKVANRPDLGCTENFAEEIKNARECGRFMGKSESSKDEQY